MYRWISVLCCLLLLTSCAESYVSPVTSGFRCQVTLDYDGTAVTAELDRTQPERAVLTVSEPAEVAGLTMLCENGELALSYAGMSLAVNSEQIPAGAAVKALCETLDSCVEQAGTAISSRVEGDNIFGRFVVLFDEQTGLPTELSIPSLMLTAAFSNWELPS